MSDSLTIFICGRCLKKNIKKYKCNRCEKYFQNLKEYQKHKTRKNKHECKRNKMDWTPIEKAPKDKTCIDLVCKAWNANTDSFSYQRFTNCYWQSTDDSGKNGSWMNVDNGWRPTHWMSIAELPSES